MQALVTQGERYVLETVSPEGKRDYEKITSIQKLLPWRAEPQPLINEGANPQTKVTTLTVAREGYYLNTRHQLEAGDPDLQADLQGECKATYGTLMRVLEKHMADDARPLTLLNYGNVHHNDERFHDGMVEFLQLTSEQAMIDWMTVNTTCPSTIADHAAPRLAVDLPAHIKAQIGTDDKAPVMGEIFIQQVVENHFRDARPNLGTVGMEIVESVVPYEEVKIRILNTSYNCITWVGTLTDQQYTHESVPTDAIYAIADRCVAEDVIPCLGNNDIDLPIYRGVVLKRSTNPYIRDTS